MKFSRFSYSRPANKRWPTYVPCTPFTGDLNYFRFSMTGPRVIASTLQHSSTSLVSCTSTILLTSPGYLPTTSTFCSTCFPSGDTWVTIGFRVGAHMIQPCRADRMEEHDKCRRRRAQSKGAYTYIRCDDEILPGSSPEHYGRRTIHGRCVELWTRVKAGQSNCRQAGCQHDRGTSGQRTIHDTSTSQTPLQSGTDTW